ncbi:hypothetical protein [Mucilaginibacter paludis]|uniref:Uncharacterized protein n=1 Tax=Mucilaginibacter paludis DSM 18603 TaxID=714943 RepID=H1Y9X9_9SPHI|nr:hypothetical protein [Mucilaginibacter paludis]EHQ24963.1 hypothetical protein Mucpa_0782 [Mucilaginibacter paludis DSM 18603]
MEPIKNTAALSAEKLFGILKTEFAGYINSKLDSGLNIGFAHVDDVINVLFPDVIEGIAFSIIVSEKEITVTENHISPEYNSGLLEQQLNDFLTLKAG